MSWVAPSFDASPASPKKPRLGKPLDTNSKDTSLTSCSFSYESSCMWVSKHKPRKPEDLVIHPKKVEELNNWLKSSQQNTKGLESLLITGPPGCGKTTTLQVLCNVLQIKISEWVTPVDRTFQYSEFSDSQGFKESPVQGFQDYLLRACRYNNVFNSQFSNSSGKIVLVKDFPNIFLHKPTTFHEVLDKLSNQCFVPIVYICSDSSICRNLFTDDLKQRCNISTINFNPIVQTSMMKALKLIMVKETKLHLKTVVLSDEKMYEICSACDGDLRSAILKLYFSTVNTCDTSNKFVNPNVVRIHGGTKRKVKNKSEPCELDKDKKLDFFQGLGRVLYPKTIPLNKSSNSNYKFVHSTDAIVEMFLSEPNTFVNVLHENYTSTFPDIKCISKAAERLSVSDTLMNKWQDKDVLHGYGLALSVQGLMVYNEHPIRTWKPMSKSRSFQTEKDSKLNELAGRNIFPDFHILDTHTLTLDILPYIGKISSILTPTQTKHVKELCYFKV